MPTLAKPKKDGDSDGKVADAKGRDVVPYAKGTAVDDALGAGLDVAPLRARLDELKARPAPTTMAEAERFRDDAKQLKADAAGVRATAQASGPKTGAEKGSPTTAAADSAEKQIDDLQAGAKTYAREVKAAYREERRAIRQEQVGKDAKEVMRRKEELIPDGPVPSGAAEAAYEKAVADLPPGRRKAVEDAFGDDLRYAVARDDLAPALDREAGRRAVEKAYERMPEGQRDWFDYSIGPTDAVVDRLAFDGRIDVEAISAHVSEIRDQIRSDVAIEFGVDEADVRRELSRRRKAKRSAV